MSQIIMDREFIAVFRWYQQTIFIRKHLIQECTWKLFIGSSAWLEGRKQIKKACNNLVIPTDKLGFFHEEYNMIFFSFFSSPITMNHLTTVLLGLQMGV